jgi:hypothetical protein
MFVSKVLNIKQLFDVRNWKRQTALDMNMPKQKTRVNISDPFVNINFEHNAMLLKLKQQ